MCGFMLELTALCFTKANLFCSSVNASANVLDPTAAVGEGALGVGAPCEVGDVTLAAGLRPSTPNPTKSNAIVTVGLTSRGWSSISNLRHSICRNSF